MRAVPSPRLYHHRLRQHTRRAGAAALSSALLVGRLIVRAIVGGMARGLMGGLLAMNAQAAPGDENPRGPDVTIIAGENRTIYEYRQAGQLRIVKIVPSIGRPYYLVPADETRGFGDLERAEMLIPRWVIVEF